MPTEGPYCEDVFFDEQVDYARHILKKHPKDKLRVVWAKSVLEPPKEISQPAKRRFRGRWPDWLSPKRKNELPSYIREQLEEQMGEKVKPKDCEGCK